MDALELRRDIFTSDLPSREKSALARVMSRIGGSGGLARAREHVMATGQVVREGAEAAVVGAVVGGLRAKLGTYIPVPGWKDAAGNAVVTIPVEAVVAGIGYAGALLMPQEEMAPTLRRVGNVAVALYTARKTEAYIAGMTGATGPYFPTAGAGRFGSGNGDFGAERQGGVESIVDFAMKKIR